MLSLDELRAGAFQPAFELPTTPVEPEEKPCETRFASSPARDEYKRAGKAYASAVKKVERDLDRYTAAFNKDWSRIDLGDKPKPSLLGTAAG